MPKVSLVDYTGWGTVAPAKRAAAMLIFAKSTRLEMDPHLIDEIMLAWPMTRINQELEYIANTIPSSWEFVNMTFLVQGVSRNFTHQFVRSRHASFAQQTFRLLDVSGGFQYHKGPSIAEGQLEEKVFESAMEQSLSSYKSLIHMGVKAEDARDILPTGTLTNILFGCNFRTFVELAHKRTSPRVQDEYRQVLAMMKSAILDVYPWSHLFIDRNTDRVMQDLDAEVLEIEDEKQRTRILKLVDQLRAKL